jgi:ABC-2 type transport system ATP-binding protein
MRLGFAVAINVEPEVLLVDEILAVGDESFQRKCITWLESFQRQGGTIVMVSHSMGTIQEMCTQVAWIQHGDLVKIGPALEVIGAYLDDVRAGQAQGDSEPRAGAGAWPDVELESVRLLDQEGKPADSVQRGGTLVVEIPYRCHRPVDHPAFTVSMHRADGAHVYTAATKDDGMELAPIEGDGMLRLVCRSLPLLGGSFVLSVGVGRAASPVVPIDQHHQRYRFEVEPKTAEQGLIGIDHSWQVEAGVASGENHA